MKTLGRFCLVAFVLSVIIVGVLIGGGYGSGGYAMNPLYALLSPLVGPLNLGGNYVTNGAWNADVIQDQLAGGARPEPRANRAG